MSKYLKLFNTYLQYLSYIEDLINFIRPNVSVCKDSPTVVYFNPSTTCNEITLYALSGNPTYPSTVAANATSFLLSFNYILSYVSTSCETTVINDSETVTIQIPLNQSTSSVTRSGTYTFHGIEIPYSVTQEGSLSAYSQQYLTFDILTAGTVVWKSNNGVVKTISYSINNGEWTLITSNSGGVSIDVSVGDKIRFKGTNNQYATKKGFNSGFKGGTATFNIEGNIMSLIGGDNFSELTSFNGYEWTFHSLFDSSNAISAEHLILPVTTLTEYCYRALFSNCSLLTTAPLLPTTTLAQGCYYAMFNKCSNLVVAPSLSSTTLVTECYAYMFTECASLTTAPELPAETVPESAYNVMFSKCTSLNYIKCLATDISAENATNSFTNSVAASGTFVKNPSMNNWSTGINGIPNGWTIEDNGVADPVISFDGEFITITCNTQNATIYYKLNNTGEYIEYIDDIQISANTFIETYAELNGNLSNTVSLNCTYSPITILAPVISCDGEFIVISCGTPHAVISYRLDGGSYQTYTTPITMSADVVVDAYASLNGRTSSVVTENCEYISVHHYDNDYLTFRIRTNGRIYWNSNGSGQAKTIEYSLNDGSWTSITAGNSSTYIAVSENDVVRFRGKNSSYASDKTNYSGFGYGERGNSSSSGYDSDTAQFDIEGNILSLVYGDNFIGLTSMTGTYNFCEIFKKSKCVSAENLILPATTLTKYCYRAMFSWCTYLITPPKLPATTLAQGCYWYMFERCAITLAPELLAEHLVAECYGSMFISCSNLNFIKCMAIDGFGTSNCKQNWVGGVASSGTFVKDSSVTVNTWTRGNGGIPTNWTVVDYDIPFPPTVSCNGLEIELSCDTQGADIYYRLSNSGSYTLYNNTAIPMNDDTYIECYSEKNGLSSTTVSLTCEYDDRTILEYSNQDINTWTRSNNTVTLPNSVNAVDGHSSSYAKGEFDYETSVNLRQAESTYLWFLHADHKADIYVDNTLVNTHWGGYNAFFTDISNYVHKGTNNIKVTLKNNNGNNLAPASGDFNFNATLGKVKLFTSPCLPAMDYGYDGFHITSTVSTASAIINVATTVPTGASVTCTITGTNCDYTSTSVSVGNEIIFTTTINNPRLWNGTSDPYLYNVKIEIYYNNELYHRYERPYGLRFYEYVIDDTVKYGTPGDPYTGFLLNGQPYLLRGCCMHDDIAGKANALNDADYTLQFNLITELGLNFLRLAHYPHPKEVYDWCDRLGIIVETEVPMVNKLETTMSEDYWTHLTGQYTDMVNQHYNHPCIMFWGLGNEAKTSSGDEGKTFAKTKLEGYASLIKSLDTERLVGIVGHHLTNPSDYFGNPDLDWFGSNLYNGWYKNTSTNNPSFELGTCITNTVTNLGKAYALSEYGCGGTQNCHSETPSTTTSSGGARHDIEYMMWLHEGHIAAIKNKPELLFSSQWVLFDFAVLNRNEGYTVCLDGENTTVNSELRRLNDKGLVERDHVTKKDVFYLYKAWWNSTPFVHICCKNYTKMTNRVIKCYTNETGTFSLYVNNVLITTATAADNIVEFTALNFSSGDIITVSGSTTTDTFTFE